jgi:hypothetical protein
VVPAITSSYVFGLWSEAAHSRGTNPLWHGQSSGGWGFVAEGGEGGVEAVEDAGGADGFG